MIKKIAGKILIKLGEKLYGKEIKDIDLKSVQKLMIHERYRENFQVTKIVEHNNEWTIQLIEKQDNIPEALKNKKIVLNGYKEPLEITDYPFVGKPLYLQFIRRKFKEAGGKQSYSNTYELHQKGMKVTPEFGAFLKEITRQELREFFATFLNIRNISEKDF